MHVAHLMIGTTPFPHDWADSVSNFARVTRLGLGFCDRPNVTYVRRLKLRPKRLFAPVNDLTDTAQLVRAIKAQGRRSGEAIELLHGHFYPSAHKLAGAARSMRLPLVVTEHSSAMTGNAAEHKQLSAGGLRRAASLYERADVVLAVSAYLARCIAERTGVQAEVVPNPVDVELFRPGVPDDDLHVVFVGRLAADKRPDLLLRGVALARQQLPLRLSIVGDGPDRAQVSALIRELELEASVTMTGRVPREEVARIVGRAHFGVSTSLVETFGVAAAECCAAGIPMVAPDQPPFDEVLPESGRLLFDPASPASLAGAIIEAADRSWDGDAIRDSIVERFSPTAVAKRLEGIYRQVLRRTS